MNKTITGIYSKLPSSFKSIAASIYGYHLKRWRYGSDTEKLVQEARERETWDADKWKNWKEKRLAFMLEHAATKVPYYREYWNKKQQQGENISWKKLENWPILTKEVLRQNPDAFITDGYDKSKMYREHTSGTTGTPLDFWCSRDLLHQWYAMFELRWRRWYGVSLQDNWAIFGGQNIIPLSNRKPPFWVWNKASNQLYMSAFHMRPEFMKYYLEALKKYNIAHIYSYSECVNQLAIAALTEKVKIKLKVVVTDAEPLFAYQKEAINKAFDCPVRETYGQAEMLCAAGECEYGKLHLWPEAGYEELLDESNLPVKNGTPGRIISTSLMNEGMPLIRYDLMDMAQFPVEQKLCDCGRAMPVVEKFMGRLDDAIQTADGRKLVQIDGILGSHLKIKEAQIIQETLIDFTVKVVPAEGWSDLTRKTLIDSLKGLIGDVNVNVEEVEEIPRTWMGKFRIVQSKLKMKEPVKNNSN